MSDRLEEMAARVPDDSAHNGIPCEPAVVKMASELDSIASDVADIKAEIARIRQLYDEALVAQAKNTEIFEKFGKPDEAKSVLLREVDPENWYDSWDDFVSDLRDQQAALREVTGWDFGVFANHHAVRTELRLAKPLVGGDGEPRCQEQCTLERLACEPAVVKMAYALAGMQNEIATAKAVLGKAWSIDGATLADSIAVKQAWLEKLASNPRIPDGWSPTGFVRETPHGAMVVSVDGDSATAMFREQRDGHCVEHELLGDDGEATMPLVEALRACDELVEDLDAGRLFDRSYGKREDR